MIPIETFKLQSCSKNMRNVTVYTMNGCNAIASNKR